MTVRQIAFRSTAVKQIINSINQNRLVNNLNPVIVATSYVSYFQIILLSHGNVAVIPLMTAAAQNTFQTTVCDLSTGNLHQR